MWKIIRINILVFIGLLLLLEITGQVIALIVNKTVLFYSQKIEARHILFSPHPYLSISVNKNVNQLFERDKEYHKIRTTGLGTRWTGADISDTTKIRVVCIGGSTTFCTGVEDEDTWPALLQQKLGNDYAVINYGVPAYNTVHAIIQLALYVTELKPDIIIYYMGGNDFYQYHTEQNYPDYSQHGEQNLPMALLGTEKYESVYSKLKRKSGIFYLVGNLGERLYPDPIMPKRYNDPDPVIDHLYRRNIRSMLALSSSMNAKEYFIGQALNPFERKKEQPWGIRVKSDRILPLMDHMNDIAKEVCATDSTCTYLDFKNMIVWKPEHYWDDMHFTRLGNDLFADKLSQIIK